MKPIEFKEQTAIIAKDQPQYLPLPAHFFAGAEGRIAFCWQLSWGERLKLLFTGQLWQQSLTFGEPLQPQLVGADKPKGMS